MWLGAIAVDDTSDTGLGLQGERGAEKHPAPSHLWVHHPALGSVPMAVLPPL